MKKLFVWVPVVLAVGMLGWFLKHQVELTDYKLDPERRYGFYLQDPQQAPEEIRADVVKGLHIMLQTKKYAADYVGGNLTCSNCHFNAGNTLGGNDGSISLVGVKHIYPKGDLTLPMRINYCFEKSMNGKPVPVDGAIMKALIAYLDWISKPTDHLTEWPWLGLPELKTTHRPDPISGKKVYETYCSNCHGDDGQGTPGKDERDIPAVWGKKSYNKRAGMNKIETAASFIYYNMPYENAYLSDEKALDVSAFLNQQERDP